MKTILTCLRASLADPKGQESRGTLLLNSALSLSGINDFGRTPEFIPYPLRPMPCQIMPVTTEILADIIEDAIVGNVN